MPRESKVESELYRHLKNILERKGGEVEGLRFQDVETQYPVDSGRADVCLLLPSKKSALVIECKRKVEVGGGIRTYEDFDPMGSRVIDQALRYAVHLGAPYFATTNGKVFALFSTPERGEPFRIDTHRVLVKETQFVEKDIEEVLITISRLYRGEAVAKTSLDWLFILRLRSFVDWLAEHLARVTKTEIGRDAQFAKEFESFVGQSGPTAMESFGRQTAYILMNKLVFYKILERHYGLRKLVPPNAKNGKAFMETLGSYFDEAMEATKDFEPVFSTGIYDALPLPDEDFVLEEVGAFIEEMDRYRLEDIGADVVGFIYERLIPDLERHRLGQFYTPPQIAELIARWCIVRPGDVVLDPASGSGTFLVKAYSVLNEMKRPSIMEDKVHREILGQIFAIDINPFPAHLTAMNLSMRDIRAPVSEMNVVVKDFFDVRPRQRILAPFALRTPGGEVKREIVVRPVDAVVANPPYTRWTEVPASTREAITRVIGPLVKQYKLSAKGGIRAGRSPGIYIHFLMHAAGFLKEGGRLGMIISNEWLHTEYGMGFARYLLGNFRIKAILDFSARQFTIPLIATNVILLEQCASARDREENETVFALITKPVPVDVILSVMGNPSAAPRTEGITITLKRQGDLPPDRPWSSVLVGVDDFLDATAKAKAMTKLGDLFDPVKGNLTWTVMKAAGLGARDFFYKTKDQVRRWGIEDYSVPALASARYASTFVFGRDDWRHLANDDKPAYLFLCHEAKSRLPVPVRGYIRWGETECRTMDKEKRVKICSETVASQQRKRMKEFRDWYDLGKLEGDVPVLFTIHNSFRRHRFMLMQFRAAVDHGFITLQPKKRGLTLEKTKAIAAYLNSDFAQLYVEVYGRALGGGTLSLDAKPLNEMPIPDVLNLPPFRVRRLARLFDELEAAGRKAGDLSRTANMRKLSGHFAKIDDEVGRLVGLPKAAQARLRTAVEAMVERRVTRVEEARPETLVSGEEAGMRPPPRRQPRKGKSSPAESLERWLGSGS